MTYAVVASGGRTQVVAIRQYFFFRLFGLTKPDKA